MEGNARATRCIVLKRAPSQLKCHLLQSYERAKQNYISGNSICIGSEENETKLDTGEQIHSRTVPIRGQFREYCKRKEERRGVEELCYNHGCVDANLRTCFRVLMVLMG